jgi:hypothetical protein
MVKSRMMELADRENALILMWCELDVVCCC